MIKTIYLGMDKVDANILLELLDSHVRAGECWGVKNTTQHAPQPQSITTR